MIPTIPRGLSRFRSKTVTSLSQLKMSRVTHFSKCETINQKQEVEWLRLGHKLINNCQQFLSKEQT
jgi:hypothetical protein